MGDHRRRQCWRAQAGAHTQRHTHIHSDTQARSTGSNSSSKAPQAMPAGTGGGSYGNAWYTHMWYGFRDFFSLLFDGNAFGTHMWYGFRVWAFEWAKSLRQCPALARQKRPYASAKETSHKWTRDLLLQSRCECVPRLRVPRSVCNIFSAECALYTVFFLFRMCSV